MSELRALIVDAAIEYTVHEGMADELGAVIGWSEDADIGLSHAIVLANSEAEDARRRLMGLVRILMSREADNV